MQYTIYSIRGVVSCLIEHLASPCALSATRPLPSYCKSRTALHARINYNIVLKLGHLIVLEFFVRICICKLQLGCCSTRMYKRLGTVFSWNLAKISRLCLIQQQFKGGVYRLTAACTASISRLYAHIMWAHMYNMCVHTYIAVNTLPCGEI